MSQFRLPLLYNMEAIKDSLTAMNEMFNMKMNEFQQELHKSSSPITASSLAADFNNFKSFTLSALNTLQRQVELISHEMDRQEMRRRKKMLLFHGVAEEKSEDLLDRVVTVIGDNLDLTDFSSSSIRSSYRLGHPSEKFRPIVVKFMDVVTRNKVWYAKTKLKGTGVTLSEFLTKPRHTAFLEARKRFGVTKCWTRDGNIHVITPDGTKHKIEYLSELESLTSSKSPQNTVPVNKIAQKIATARPKRLVKK